MFWTVTRLNAAALSAVLGQQESHFLDFKDSRNIAKIEKTASAFANADGGELYVGVGDPSETDRLFSIFRNQEAANPVVTQIMNIFSQGPEFILPEFFEIPEKGYILLFTVQKTPYVVRTSSGHTFRRQNAQDRELKNANDLLRLELEKGVQSFEDSRVDANASELLSSSTFSTFLRHVTPTSNAPDFLRKERLVVEDSLRACALILFDDNPQSLLPHSSAKIYRYKTLGEEGHREELDGQPFTIEGSAYDIIKGSVAKAKEIIESIPKLEASGFVAIQIPRGSDP